jgi:hypothetical protein
MEKLSVHIGLKQSSKHACGLGRFESRASDHSGGY